MHHNVLCRHIHDKAKVFEVEASIDGVASINGARFQLGWCRRCQPVSDWGSRGACRPYPPSWWLNPTDHERELAKAICAGCVVRTTCLAIAADDDEAICGGLTDIERAATQRAS